MIDESDFINRVKKINWADFDTAYGKAIETPNQLISLAGSNHKAAMDASHELWCSLCHQHAYVSSAALPAFPFILEVLNQANEDLTIEILDIFLGFALCTNRDTLGYLPEGFMGRFGIMPEWINSLRKELTEQLIYFSILKESKNENVSDFATRIIEELEK